MTLFGWGKKDMMQGAGPKMRPWEHRVQPVPDVTGIGMGKFPGSMMPQQIRLNTPPPMVPDVSQVPYTGLVDYPRQHTPMMQAGLVQPQEPKGFWQKAKEALGGKPVAPIGPVALGPGGLPADTYVPRSHEEWMDLYRSQVMQTFERRLAQSLVEQGALDVTPETLARLLVHMNKKMGQMSVQVEHLTQRLEEVEQGRNAQSAEMTEQSLDYGVTAPPMPLGGPQDTPAGSMPMPGMGGFGIGPDTGIPEPPLGGGEIDEGLVEEPEGIGSGMEGTPADAGQTFLDNEQFPEMGVSSDDRAPMPTGGDDLVGDVSPQVEQTPDGPIKPELEWQQPSL